MYIRVWVHMHAFVRACVCARACLRVNMNVCARAHVHKHVSWHACRQDYACAINNARTSILENPTHQVIIKEGMSAVLVPCPYVGVDDELAGFVKVS